MDIWCPFVTNPPVTLQLGFPIVDMPGCVNMHKDNKDHVTGRPFDKDLVNQDPKGTTHYVLMVSIHHMMRWIINQSNLIITEKFHHHLLNHHLHHQILNLMQYQKQKQIKKIECPAPNQPRVGDITQSGDERVIGHELSEMVRPV